MRYFVIATILGGAFIFFGWSDQAFQISLERDGVVVPGLITGGESREGRRSYHRFDVVYWVDEQPTNKTFSVTKSYFAQHTAGEEITVPEVEVRYLPSNPQSAILVGGEVNSAWMLWPGIGAFAIGLVGTAIGLLRMKQTS